VGIDSEIFRLQVRAGEEIVDVGFRHLRVSGAAGGNASHARGVVGHLQRQLTYAHPNDGEVRQLSEAQHGDQQERKRYRKFDDGDSASVPCDLMQQA
jgi:hypothetical protein